MSWSYSGVIPATASAAVLLSAGVIGFALALLGLLRTWAERSRQGAAAVLLIHSRRPEPARIVQYPAPSSDGGRLSDAPCRAPPHSLPDPGRAKDIQARPISQIDLS
jgi:hypothetical protein